MSPEEYRRRQNTVTAALRTALAPLLRTLRGRPNNDQWGTFLDAAYPLIHRARVESWQLAADFYAAQRRAQLTSVSSRRDETAPPTGDSTRDETTGDRAQLAVVSRDETPDVPRRNYPPRALTAAYRPVRARLDGLDAGERPPGIVTDTAVRVAERHARDAGREAVVDAARHDPAALGYARRALSANPCTFCLMLVSRGAVYKSATAALLRDGTGEPYHDGCSCLAVPVFNRDTWPGREEADRLEAEWRTAGGTLADFRRHIAQQHDPAEGEERRVATA